MHFTRVFAGFAFTNTSLPKAIRFPAFVAGFFFSLIIVIPGMVNFPEAFSSPGIKDSRAPKTSPFGIARPFAAVLTRFIAFIAFMAFMVSRRRFRGNTERDRTRDR